LNRISNVGLAERHPPIPQTDHLAAGAVLTVDLSAIRANYRLLKQMLGTSLCAAVVKADAYGLHAATVARALVREGCETFFVAHVTEGVSLRDTLGAGPAIYVLNGLPPGAEALCFQAGLIPVLNSEPQLLAWRGMAAAGKRKLRAAIQVDSGMARLGMSAAEIARITADPKSFDGIDVVLVMSHLARADEPLETANAAQKRNFDALIASLPRAPASLANSSGIFLGSGYHYDLARPGAALYGINPTPGRPNPMHQVVRLEARVIQTRHLESGAGVGYGHTYFTNRAATLATISLGYGDGWHRHSAAGAFFEGQRLPFIGRVSMDSIIIEITSLPEGTLREGDLVELIGEHQTVDDVAGHAGTIGYEVLTGLGARFHRIYKDD